MDERILSIGGDESLPQAVVGAAGPGVELVHAATAAAGLALFERLRPDLVIVDQGLPDTPGLEVLERLVARGAVVIVLAGQSDAETPARAMQLGAEHALREPVSQAHLTAAVARAWEKIRLRRENDRLRSPERWGAELETLGSAPLMRELARQLRLAAGESTPLLLSGERGTGKGRAARLVHELGPRRRAPYLEIRCSGASASMLEAQLLGGGTICFDEIEDLPLELQGRLAQELERPRLPAMRVIAATCRDLSLAVQQGRFVSDLYERLRLRTIRLPALRQWAREDRLRLLARLMAELQAQLPDAPSACTTEATDRLLAAPWPGNVRELRNVLERAMLIAAGSAALAVEHLPSDLRAGGTPDGEAVDPRAGLPPAPLAEIERQHIERVLRFHGGNRTRAAHDLGISRATLINKIKAFALNL